MIQQGNSAFTDKDRRKMHIEIMRIIAVIAVIYNHTGNIGYAFFSECKPGSFSFWFFLVNAVFCKFAVPLFFMISGALMLGKPDERIRTTYRKRVLKYLLILIFISAFYAVSHIVLYGNEYTVRSFFRALYTSSLKYHLGFLYVYISFLIMLPLLRVFCKGMESRHFLYLMSVYFCICLLPALQYLLWRGSVTLNPNIYPSLSGFALVIPLAGFFCEHMISAQAVRKHLWIVWLIDISCIVLVCAATYIRGIDIGTFAEDKSQVFFEGLSWVTAVTVYLTVRCFFARVCFSERVRKAILVLSRASFGMYLFHPFMKNLLDLRITGRLQSLPAPPVIKAWLYVLSIFGTSYVFTWILRQVSERFLRCYKTGFML